MTIVEGMEIVCCKSHTSTEVLPCAQHCKQATWLDTKGQV